MVIFAVSGASKSIFLDPVTNADDSLARQDDEANGGNYIQFEGQTIPPIEGVFKCDSTDVRSVANEPFVFKSAWTQSIEDPNNRYHILKGIIWYEGRCLFT